MVHTSCVAPHPWPRLLLKTCQFYRFQAELVVSPPRSLAGMLQLDPVRTYVLGPCHTSSFHRQSTGMPIIGVDVMLLVLSSSTSADAHSKLQPLLLSHWPRLVHRTNCWPSLTQWRSEGAQCRDWRGLRARPPTSNLLCSHNEAPAVPPPLESFPSVSDVVGYAFQPL